MGDFAPDNTPDPAMPEATQLLLRVSGGDAEAVKDLLPVVYEELRARAGAYFRGQPANHTLQPTALVHEAYLCLPAGRCERPAEWWSAS